MKDIQEHVERTKNEFLRFWNLKNEQPLVSVKAYEDKKGYLSYLDKINSDKRYSSSFHLKTDPQVKIDHQVQCLKYMYFAGETLPILSTAIGPGICSAFLGSIVDLGKPDEPTWFYENLYDWNKFHLKFDERNIWWNIQKNIVKYSAIAAKEEGFLSEIPVDLFNGIDTLMLLRGSEKLALDLLIEPDRIKDANKKIIDLWKYWTNELFSIQQPHFEGNSVAWLNLWGPGRTFCLQSDFMTLISAEQYEEFILDDIKLMCNHLDHVMFHFDGPDEIIRHLDFLLEIPNLHGIQWNPETNCENVRHIPVLKKIQNAGKCLILNINKNEIDELLKELSPAGLLLNVNPFDEPLSSMDEADFIIKHIKR